MVSVCLACYNGERYIKEQISSILRELRDSDELVISDDGSTDGTLRIIEEFGDPRIKLYKNDGIHGVNGNFENALRHSHGEYIFLADQDDIWLEGKVKACKEALQQHKCVVHDAYITDGNLNVIRDSFFEAFNCKPGFLHNWIRNGYLGCAMAFRREILDTALPIPRKLPVWQDIWIGSLAALTGDVVFIPLKGIKFRRHSSTTSITSKSSFSLCKKITYRMQLLWYLFKRLKINK